MSAASTENPSLELGRFATVLRRRWLAVATGLVIGGLLGLLSFLYLPTTATAATLVNVNVISTQPFAQDRPSSDLLDSQTESQLARSSRVVSEVSRGLGGVTPQEVRRAATASLLPDGTVVRITYAASTQARAQAGANDLAQQYLEYRSELAQDRVDSVAEKLTARRDDLATQLTDLQLRNTPTVAASVRARLDSQAQVATQALNSVVAELADLQAVDTSGGTVLTSADGATTTISPRPWIMVLSALLGGLMLGLLLALLVHLADRRVRDAHDVEAAGGGPLLTRVRRGTSSVPPAREEADAMRSLRERLLATLPARGAVVTIADVSRHGVPSHIATNLALVSAQVGMRVHLIVPEQSSRFVQDLSRILDLAPVESTHRLPLLVSRRHPNVSVTLPLRDVQGDDNSADQVAELLAESDEPGFDLTLIALPHDASRSVRLTAARLGHNFVLVVTERDTRIEQIAELTTELAAVDALVPGTVLVSRGRGQAVSSDDPSGMRRRGSAKSTARGKRGEGSDELDDGGVAERADLSRR
jgi:capsular polysaccharide biosynthesis protein